MWRKIKLVFAVSIFTLSLAMTISSSFAQDSTRDGVGTTTTTLRDDKNEFDLGWIGLAGLAGLVGLMPRDRTDRTNRTDRKDPNLTR